MKILILMGSPKENGNTATLLKPFISEMEANNADIKYISLYGKNISPCTACKVCQNILNEYGCPQKDDMYEIVDEIMKADLFILATPIYIWYCTAPMKAMLDRLYGMMKYYGDTRGPSLLERKKCGIIATCGYDIEYGVSPFEDGIKRFCKHFRIEYAGKIVVVDSEGDDQALFKTDSAIKTAVDFARKVIGTING